MNLCYFILFYGLHILSKGSRISQKDTVNLIVKYYNLQPYYNIILLCIHHTSNKKSVILCHAGYWTHDWFTVVIIVVTFVFF